MKKSEKENSELGSTDLIDKGNYLINHGWVQENQMIYTKKGIEIFFDNSNAIEIYKVGDYESKLDDFYASTVNDLLPLLDLIKECKYKI